MCTFTLLTIKIYKVTYGREIGSTTPFDKYELQKMGLCSSCTGHRTKRIFGNVEHVVILVDYCTPVLDRVCPSVRRCRQ